MVQAKGSVNQKMKQEQSLGKWLTHVFEEANCGPEKAAAAAAQGPSALRALVLSRQDTKARNQVKGVFNAPGVQRALGKLENEIASGKLAMRPDRNVATDVGLRDHLLQIILGINCVWLRPAVEVVFGKTVPRSNVVDSLNLYRFLVSNLTRNDELCVKFNVSKGISDLNTNPQYYTELNLNLLSKFFSLILLLDESKTAQIIDNDPCLFRISPELQLPAGVVNALVLKSTRDAVAAFSKEFLSKEGNVFNHLEKDMGINLTFQQTPIDEYDYSIKSLIPDLQNGVVLARLVELVTSRKNVLLPKLRVPTVSRLQKIHNVGVVLEELRSVRVTDFPKEMVKKTAELVVEGNRDQVLSLIVSIVHGLQLPSLIDADQVKEEISRVRSRRAFAGEGNQAMQLADKPAKLLLQWCGTIAAHLGMQVDNFTSSFSNGHVLLGLVSFYLPDMVPLDDIVLPDDEAGRLPKDNFRLFCAAIEDIGGVPPVLKASDINGNIPEESTVMLMVGYLCMRLIDLGKDTRAAMTLQRTWRHVLHLKRLAALADCTALIQRVWRGHQGRAAASKKVRTIVQMQALVRSHLELRKYQHVRTTAVQLQCWVRVQRAVAVTEHVRMVRDCLALLTAKVAERKQQVIENRLRHMIRHTITLQKIQRGNKARRLVRDKRAAIAVQRVYKGYRQRKAFRTQKRAAIVIQANFRCFNETEKYQITRDRLIVLQSVYRGWSQQQKYQQDRCKLIKLQAEWRRFTMEESFKMQKASAIKIQAMYRGYSQQQKYQQTCKLLIFAQAVCRGFMARRFVAEERRRMNHASLAIQCLWRGYAVRKETTKAIRSINTIQAHYRGWRERMQLWNACKHLAAKAREMRKRIEEARKQVQEHLKLGNKTKAGIEVLLSDPSISKSMQAVQSLELATRLSGECVQCITELGAVESLYKLVADSGRSLPEMKLARACLDTLNNFSIYKDKFRQELSPMPLCASTLAEFIESKRDDDHQEAALAAIKLLRFICEDPFNAAEIAAIRSIKGAPTPFERLNRTLTMLEKKAPKAVVPLANANGSKGKPAAANNYNKCIKALKALIKTVGENK